MQFNVNLSGTITLVHQLPAGTAPAVTQAQLEAALKTFGDQLMSKLSDKIAQASKTADDAITRVQTDVSGLKAQIAALQVTVDSGGASQADLDALDALNAKVAAIDPTQTAVLPPPASSDPAQPGGPAA